MARGLRFRGDDAHTLAHKVVHQRGFTNVGIPDNIDESGFMVTGRDGRACHLVSKGADYVFCILALYFLAYSLVFVFFGHDRDDVSLSLPGCGNAAAGMTRVIIKFCD